MPIQEKPSFISSRNQVGYFLHLKMEEKHMGAIMVTNQIGVPLEFKYSEPVTATKLHKILYGSVLDKYLHETVIRDRLVKEMQSTPNYFITSYEEKEFLSALADREMMAIQKYALPPQEFTGTFTRIREREAIIEFEGDAIFLRLAFSTNDEKVQHAMAAWLKDIARTMDVLEPLDRISAALTSLCGDGKLG
jgi:hypothetical protein